MITHQVHFARYRKGETRISNPQWISGEDFSDIAGRARQMLIGMSGADPESAYTIASIAAEYHGSVINCDGGRMFETADELAARVASPA